MTDSHQPARVGAAFVDTVTGCHFRVRYVGRGGVTGMRVASSGTGQQRLYSWREWFGRCRPIEHIAACSCSNCTATRDASA